MRSALVLLLLGAACGSATAPCDEAGAVTGSWRYLGAQTTPSQAALNGTLEIVDRCGTISGQVDMVEVSASGQARRITGPVTGRVVDAGSLRFDILVDGTMRQHLARVAGDSLWGSWLALGSGASQSWTGTFTARQEGR